MMRAAATRMHTSTRKRTAAIVATATAHPSAPAPKGSALQLIPSNTHTQLTRRQAVWPRIMSRAGSTRMQSKDTHASPPSSSRLSPRTTSSVFPLPAHSSEATLLAKSLGVAPSSVSVFPDSIRNMKPFVSVEEIWGALEEQKGMSDGETVDLWEHQLQAAEQLESRGADQELVVAGLLHDLGDGRVAESEHAAWAARMVRPLLGDRIAWIIGAHTETKRYLCTTDSSYFDRLSPVSQRTVLLQGGILMSKEEIATFRASPWAEDAIFLRQCDDAAKDEHHRVHQPERFKVLLEKVAAQVASKKKMLQMQHTPAVAVAQTAVAQAAAKTS